jgi:hypothetical protein
MVNTKNEVFPSENVIDTIGILQIVLSLRTIGLVIHVSESLHQVFELV